MGGDGDGRVRGRENKRERESEKEKEIERKREMSGAPSRSIDGAGGKHRNMKQSLHWKVKNLLSPSAFDLPLGASVLIVPALSSSSSSTSSSSSISCSLQSQVKCIAYPRVYASTVSTHPPCAL